MIPVALKKFQAMESFLSAAAKCENDSTRGFCAKTKFLNSKDPSTNNPTAF